MKAALSSLAVGLAVAWGTPVAAQEVDGLNADLRGSLYNEATAFTATVRLAAVSQEALIQMVNGLFDPASLAILKQSQKDFDRQVEGQTSGYTAVTSALAGLGYERMTVVGLNYQGQVMFGALDLGFDVNEAVFLAAKSALEGVFSANGFALEITQRGNYALLHLPGSGLPPVGHSRALEEAILAGLSQARGTPAVNVVAPTSDYVRGMLGASPGAASDFGRALGEATYIGGYLVTGSRPEIHLYARFSGDKKAESVVDLYNKSWERQMADATAADLKHEQDIKDGQITTKWYIDNRTMYGRIRAHPA